MMNTANIVFPLALAMMVTDGMVGAWDAWVTNHAPLPISGSASAISNVSAGDTVMVSWIIHKRTECPGENNRVWVGQNGFYISEPLGQTTLPATEEPRIYNVPTKIPEQAPPGMLEYHITGYYSCRYGEKNNFDLGPVTFEVVE